MQTSGLIGQVVSAVNSPLVTISGQPVINFANTQYLGLNRHPEVLKALVTSAYIWGVSLGTPRRYADTPLARQLEAKLAHLVCQERALLFPSTTHLAMDVIPALARNDGLVLIDRDAYPLSWQGARLAAAQGARLAVFTHNDPDDLNRLLHRLNCTGRRVIVVDGVYPSDARLAPLIQLQDLADNWDAWLYVDDAHGLGVLGSRPDDEQPLGVGGCGSPGFWGMPSGRVIHIASLSKAFGIPLAFAAGPKKIIARLRIRAGSLEHSSPPALPLLSAALAALKVHHREGQSRRRALLRAARYLRGALESTGLILASDTFPPIQTVLFDAPRPAYDLACKLRLAGIWSVVQFNPPDRIGGGALRFLVSACHQPQHFQRLADIFQTLAPLENTSNHSLVKDLIGR